MYGFSIAACSVGMQFQLQELPLMIHPPFDQEARAPAPPLLPGFDARFPRVVRQFGSMAF